MAKIRVPKQAELLLPFVERDMRPNDQAFFPTYAHLIVFAASVGHDADKYDPNPDFIRTSPEPIDLEIFRNRRLYQLLQLLAISRTQQHEIASKEDQVAEIAEGYASAGLSIIKTWYDSVANNNAIFIQKIAGEILLHSLPK